MKYNYSDIYLVPRYSELESRSYANTSVEFLGRKFNLPVIPANMESVIDERFAKWCSENNYFYIMHRFGDTVGFIRKANKENWKLINISVGVNCEDNNLINWIKSYKHRVDIIFIDIAHGDHKLVKEMINWVKSYLPKTKVVAGNVATKEAIIHLAEWGADAAKVGIAGGFACSTKNVTGFHIPMFDCVLECSRSSPIPIIADGGIRENGDITKALVAGATMVMAGSMFAACKDAPGENIDINYGIYPNNKTITHKRYWGSASYRQKEQNKHIEGIEMEIPCNGFTIEEKYQDITESLQSAISYGGGKDLSCFKNVQWITVK